MPSSPSRIDGQRRRTLAAVANRIVPADEWPSAGDAGVVEYLQRHAGDVHRRLWDELLGAGLDALAAAGFVELGPADQDRLLGRVERGEVEGWPVDPRAFFGAIVSVVAEGYYTSPDDPDAGPPASWEMVGFEPRPPGAAPALPDEADPPTVALESTAAHYDVVVVGAGAGGGAAAAALAGAGRRVLLVERGRWLPYDQVGRDHLRNHRLNRYGINTGPVGPGYERTYLADGLEVVTEPYESTYHNNAMTFGGGTRVFGAQAWRFLPGDFAMASRYGVPEGSSLADWPITYADLEPYYERAEWAIGVSGDTEGHEGAGPRRQGYPMAPMPLDLEARVLTTGAGQLGWPVGAVPLLVNSRPWGGRPGCERCGRCVGFACPVNAKNGPYNTVLPAALASGRCDLVLEAMVDRLTADSRGRVSGVSIVADAEGGVVRRTVTADQVVVAGGAIESARLLLNSPTTREPAGIGNNSDQVGRHLQGHAYSGAFGLFDQAVQDGLGPGPSVATLRFGHGNDGIVGGGMLANEFVKLPYHYWLQAIAPDAARWGLVGKRAVREGYHRTIQIMGPTQEIPHPDARVRLSPTVKDRFGVPVPMLSGHLHPETVRTASFMSEQAATWLRAAGARQVWSYPVGSALTAGQHQAGTLRMGEDPITSVTDRDGRVHGHDNLWVADGSVHVTNGCVNPVLTILALALRATDRLLTGG
jgi:choline dehydrogenase-like flavoprotein